MYAFVLQCVYVIEYTHVRVIASIPRHTNMNAEKCTTTLQDGTVQIDNKPFPNSVENQILCDHHFFSNVCEIYIKTRNIQ